MAHRPVHEPRDSNAGGAQPPPPSGTEWQQPKGSPLFWLLIPLVVVPLATPLLSFENPRLFGFPFFYWFEILWTVIAAITLFAIYKRTKDY